MATRRRIPQGDQPVTQSTQPPATPPSIPIEYTSKASYPPSNGGQLAPSGGSDWVSGLRLRTIRVSLPQQTFSPVEYHTFSIPALTAEFEAPESVAAELAIERALDVLRKAQQAAFERELVRYLENVMNAGKRAFDLQAEKQLPPRVPG